MLASENIISSGGSFVNMFFMDRFWENGRKYPFLDKFSKEIPGEILNFRHLQANGSWLVRHRILCRTRDGKLHPFSSLNHVLHENRSGYRADTAGNRGDGIYDWFDLFKPGITCNGP